MPLRAAVSLLALIAMLGVGDIARAELFDAPLKAEAQPLLLHARNLAEAMDYLGAPLSAEARVLLDKAANAKDLEAAALVQQALDPLCLAGVHINPESRVKVVAGPAKPELYREGWRQFLVKVHNEAGVTAKLKAASPQAAPLANSPAEQVRDRWLDLQMFECLDPTGSGPYLVGIIV